MQIRHWEIGDTPELAKALNNRNIQNNLRDGLPYPYTENDAIIFIKAMLNADQNKTFAMHQMVGPNGLFLHMNTSM